MLDWFDIAPPVVAAIDAIAIDDDVDTVVDDEDDDVNIGMFVELFCDAAASASAAAAAERFAAIVLGSNFMFGSNFRNFFGKFEKH